MTFDQIKKRIGKNLKYYDDTNGWLTGRDVTETDIGDFVNEIYTERLFPLFASRYPHMFRQVTLFNSWILDATVATGTGDQTLEITTDADTAFANSMEGLFVYNEDQDDTAQLKTYVDSGTFTVEDDYDLDDWADGDTIYILGQEFAFGGDSVDIFSIESIGVKMTSNDEFFKKCEIRDKQDVLQYGGEVFSAADPVAYVTSMQDTGAMYNAFGILPGFEEKLSNAIEVDYIAKPSPITGSGVTPVIPVQNSLISGGTMRAYEKRQDYKAAAYWRRIFEDDCKKDISRFRPMTTNRPTDIKVDRNAYYRFRRII